MRNQTTLILVGVTGMVVLAASVQALLREPPALPEINAQTPPTSPETTEPSSTAPAPALASASPAELRDALGQEIAARQKLTDKVARLEKELTELKSRMEGVPSTSNRAPTVSESAPAPIDASRDETPSESERARQVGMDQSTVAQIRTRFEQLEMDRLYLKDRAQREGWSGTVRYSNEVAKIEDKRADIRSSLGEDQYDAYLYANGDANRVLIRELITGSPAGAAGLKTGDVVLRYDGKRIFTTRELQTATGAGRVGENVPVEVDRDGQTMTLYVPRGPLGVYLDMHRSAP